MRYSCTFATPPSVASPAKNEPTKDAAFNPGMKKRPHTRGDRTRRSCFVTVYQHEALVGALLDEPRSVPSTKAAVSGDKRAEKNRWRRFPQAGGAREYPITHTEGHTLPGGMRLQAQRKGVREAEGRCSAKKGGMGKIIPKTKLSGERKAGAYTLAVAPTTVRVS